MAHNMKPCDVSLMLKPKENPKIQKLNIIIKTFGKIGSVNKAFFCFDIDYGQKNILLGIKLFMNFVKPHKTSTQSDIQEKKM